MQVSGYRLMWILVMFDLPTDTKEARAAYRTFRETLKDLGFSMIQYSIYSRSSASEEAAKVHMNKIKLILPDDGQIRVIILTDKQYGRMEFYCGKIRAPTEKAPEQLEFF